MLPIRKHTALSLPSLDANFFNEQAQAGAQWIHTETQGAKLKWLAPSGWTQTQIEKTEEPQGFSTLVALRHEDDTGAAILRWSPCPTPVDPGDFLDAAIGFNASHACAYQRDHGSVSERSCFQNGETRTDTALWTSAGLFWISCHCTSSKESVRQSLRTLGHTLIFGESLGSTELRNAAQSTTLPLAWTQNSKMILEESSQGLELTLGDNQTLKIKISPIDPSQGPARAINMAMVNAHKTHGRLVPGTLQQVELTWPESHWSDKVRIRTAKSPTNREVVLLAGSLGPSCPVLIEADYPARETDTFGWLACRKELTEVIFSLVSNP